jgi:hypothetical protein
MARQDALSAHLVLLNGPVLPMDAHDTVTQAVAVRDGRVVAVGSTAEIKSLARAGRLPVRVQMLIRVIELNFSKHSLLDLGLVHGMGSK